ncbi:unnamed protein product [Arctogadus glacialis]
MTGCVAINCVNRSESKISLYSPPLRQKESLRQWLKNINRMSSQSLMLLCLSAVPPSCITSQRPAQLDLIPLLQLFHKSDKHKDIQPYR